MNVVPKTGGQLDDRLCRVRRQQASALQSDNYTDALKAQGLTTPIPLTNVVRPQRRGRRPDQEGPPLVAS